MDATLKEATPASDQSGDDEYQDEGEDEDDLSSAQLSQLRRELTAARTVVKTLKHDCAANLVVARSQLSPDQEQALVMGILRSDLAERVGADVGKHRQYVVEALENWWDKYGIPLKTIEAQRNLASARLVAFLRDLGYE